VRCDRAGVRLEVTEAVLNHLSGSRAGVVGIYQRHDLGRGETRCTRRMVCAPSRRSGRQADCSKDVASQPTHAIGLKQSCLMAPSRLAPLSWGQKSVLLQFIELNPGGSTVAQEYEFEVTITAVVHVRAESESLARELVVSSALASPSRGRRCPGFSNAAIAARALTRGALDHYLAARFRTRAGIGEHSAHPLLRRRLLRMSLGAAVDCVTRLHHDGDQPRDVGEARIEQDEIRRHLRARYLLFRLSPGAHLTGPPAVAASAPALGAG
jgi:hypothetical protein